MLLWLTSDNLKFYVSKLDQLYHCAVVLKKLLVCVAGSRGCLAGLVAPPTVEGYLTVAPEHRLEGGVLRNEIEDLEGYI